VGVEFFCYHRDRPGSITLRDELLEEHWSYMDRFQPRMIARGPTLADDGTTWLGTGALGESMRDAATDLEAQIYDATTLRDIEVEGDNVPMRWQTLYMDRGWKIAGFIGYLPNPMGGD
jgi:uncharacterized protein YciI